MGAKLFAWIGGLALFLGVVFFVKYAFERNLIPPAVRVAIGFITGAGLVVAGVLTHRKKAYAVLGQTFCASGALISYGVTFAAHELYQFPAFGPVTTFLVMCAITTIAFVLAVRMNAPVIAILGMAGGFLTPLLVSTGQDHVLGLFSYIALLDIGLLAVARFRGWAYLSVLAAAGTLVMEAGWYLRFFEKGHYFEGAITWIPVAIFVVFVGLFAVAGWRVKRMQVGDGMHQFGSAIALGAGALLFAFSFLDSRLHHVETRHLVWLCFCDQCSDARHRGCAAKACLGARGRSHRDLRASCCLDSDAPETGPATRRTHLLFGVWPAAFGVSFGVEAIPRCRGCLGTCDGLDSHCVSRAHLTAHS
jgi:uncharacterized membrane protein